MVTLTCVLGMAHTLADEPWKLSALRKHRACRVYRSPSLACACATALRTVSNAPGADDSAAPAESRAVDARDAVYMLNPSGDLPHTQDTFQDFFRQQRGWQVLTQFTSVLPLFMQRQSPQPHILMLIMSFTDEAIRGTGGSSEAALTRTNYHAMPLGLLYVKIQAEEQTRSLDLTAL